MPARPQPSDNVLSDNARGDMAMDNEQVVRRAYKYAEDHGDLAAALVR
jgi:hypothetical protein